MRSASSMQTPPPTSTSASKRKAQQAQVAKLVKESAANGGRKTTTIFPKPTNAVASTSPIEASPQQFSTIQFSPEVLGSFSMGGPATAPVYPQQKLFWDPNQESNGMNIDFGTADTFADSFGMETSKQQIGSLISNNDGMNITQIPSSSFGVDNIMGLVVPTTASAAHHTNYLSTAGLITNGSGSRLPNTVVDPSLLFSSPSQAPEHPNVGLHHEVVQNDNLQPYAHQIREARRERESSETRKPKRRRGPQTESPAVKAALETLRGEEEERSRGDLDTGGSAKLSRQGLDSNRVAFERPDPTRIRARKSSSVHKGLGLRHHAPSQKPEKRTVTLSIGPDGRAKTETQVVTGAHSPSMMNVDSDSGDTESLSSDDGYLAASQPTSFAYPAKKVSLSNFNRLGSGLGNQQNSSYNSSQANMIDPALTTTFISGPLGESKAMDSEVETVIDSDNERGDAQSELKKIVKNRVQRRNSEKSNRLWSVREHLENRNTFTGNAFGAQQALTPTQDIFQNISPTTITDPDLATPSSARDSTMSGNSTRCVCHNPDTDGEFMILW